MINLDQVAAKVVETVKRKNAAYGGAFEDDLNEFGLTPAAIQMGHKIKRFKTLLKNKDADDNGESLLDSVLDMAGYGLLTLEWASRNPGKIE